jgi:hypothetical protein
MKPDQSGMECWVDAAHASEWSNKTASNDPSKIKNGIYYKIFWIHHALGFKNEI